MSKRIAVIRVRGEVGVRRKVEDILRRLMLTRVNHCVVVDDSPESMGMVKKCSSYITWGEITPDTLALLVMKRGRAPGNKKIGSEEIESYGLGSFEKFAEKLCNFECKLSALKCLKPVFRLHPPRKGYRHIKKPYPQGALGYRGDKINELLKRMV
ncbi:MAG: 50S ribosomal protein L30 [Candidatus Micrarchaeota archaeon]|nr:50S ribosomal protein L30 [Candidatus Micrarchaeota archaeon]